MVRAVISKTLFLSEHAIVYRWAYFYRLKFCLQIIKTTEYQLNNDVIAASFCSENKSMLEKFGHFNP